MVRFLQDVSNNVDCKLNNRSIKRPDASYTIKPPHIPNPRPGWMKLKPNGIVYPNIVVEIAVNNQSPTKLLNDCERYFSRNTSIRVWIGITYWRPGRKFWVGWAERRPGGVGARMHTEMDWPPGHCSIDEQTDIIYSIPMATIFGPNITIPPNISHNLLIDTDEIRLEILNYV